MPMGMMGGGFSRPWFGSGERRCESSDDRHVQVGISFIIIGCTLPTLCTICFHQYSQVLSFFVIQAKHAEIYPDDAQLASVDRLVTMVERALKGVSDHLAEK